MKEQLTKKDGRKRISALLGLAFLATATMLGVSLGIRSEHASAADSWGPQDRATFTWASPADHVTFNSITDNPSLGDERNFVRVRESGTDDTYLDSVSLEVGKTYDVYIYIHNNASASLNSSGAGIAENVTLSTSLPEKVEDGQSAVVKATISSTNSTPESVWDTAYLDNNTGKTIYLRYVHDSAVITNSGSGSGSILDADSLFSDNGAYLLYYSDAKYRGMIPGCNEYAGYVVYQVTADSPEFSATKEVSASGKEGYSDVVATAPGVTLDFTITYRNTGTTEQTYVTVYDTLPDGLTFVPGSVTVIRDDGTAVDLENGDLLFSDGIVIGNYVAGETATISYQATLAGEDEFDCGETVLYNESQVATANGTITDKTKITVEKSCEEEPETPSSIPNTGPGEIALLAVIIIAIGGGTAYYVHTKHALRLAKAGAGVGGKNVGANDMHPADAIGSELIGTKTAESADGKTPESADAKAPDPAGINPSESTDNKIAGTGLSASAITGISTENFGQGQPRPLGQPTPTASADTSAVAPDHGDSAPVAENHPAPDQDVPASSPEDQPNFDQNMPDALAENTPDAPAEDSPHPDA